MNVEDIELAELRHSLELWKASKVVPQGDGEFVINSGYVVNDEGHARALNAGPFDSLVAANAFRNVRIAEFGVRLRRRTAETTKDSFRRMVREFRAAREKVREARNRIFPDGTQIEVDHKRYKGKGVVVIDGKCPDGLLPVRIENGNVWFYEIETCIPL